MPCRCLESPFRDRSATCRGAPHSRPPRISGRRRNRKSRGSFQPFVRQRRRDVVRFSRDPVHGSQCIAFRRTIVRQRHRRFQHRRPRAALTAGRPAVSAIAEINRDKDVMVNPLNRGECRRQQDDCCRRRSSRWRRREPAEVCRRERPSDPARERRPALVAGMQWTSRCGS